MLARFKQSFARDLEIMILCEAAKNSLASTIGELTDVLPSLASCRKAGARLVSDTTQVIRLLSSTVCLCQHELRSTYV